MSENNNLDSTNLSIPVDAFEQFQANSMYEEEEYITLSDIVSPDPTAPQLPSDISEIPYDNEVVLSVNDDPNLEDLPGSAVAEQTNSAEAEQTDSAEPEQTDSAEAEQTDSVEAEQTDSAKVSILEDNVTTEQPVEEASNQNQGRPKRIRKKKSYVEDFVTDSDDYKNRLKNDVSKSKNGNSFTPNTKSRRGRKPKQNAAQNETTQPENNGHENSLEKTFKSTKRGRKKVSNVPASDNWDIVDPSENHQEAPKSQLFDTMNQNTAVETTDSIKPNARKQVNRRKKGSNLMDQESFTDTPDAIKTAPRKKSNSKKESLEENSSKSEEQADAESNISAELISDSSLLNSTSKQTALKRGKGRRGRPKKTEKKEPTVLESNDTQQQLNDSTLEDTDFSATAIRKPGRRGRKKKILQEETIESNDKSNIIDAEDEYDNVSLKVLSKGNEDNDVKPLSQEISGKSDVNYDNPQPSESEEIDIGDDMSLRQLKETLDVANTEVQDMELDETVDTMNNSDINNDINADNNNADNETHNIDSYIKEEIKENDSLLQEHLIEDESKRPNRRRARKIMHYDEGSDEDPFANVELSDDEPRGKKGRYYSDDEYVPGSENKKGTKARASITSEDDSDISEIDEDLEDCQKGKRKRLFSANKSPRGKKGKIGAQETTDVNVTTIAPKAVDDVDDIEVCLQSSVIQTNDTKQPTSIYTNEFENFIAQKIQGKNIQIKKVSSKESSQSLEIPVLDQDAKKSVEVSVQTNIVKTTSSGVQTSIQHEIPMKDNVPLSTEQSEQACEFLKSIVKTTSELGQLMTEKSEDFITKKINIKNVTDTFKMDYCVKKSFLLLKLAKHNIVQMEDDLTKQYEEFLKRTNLISHREEQKTIKPSEKDSDSDCEIVEEPQSSATSKKGKPKFNPKTVFLNKELSIKIAKKPPTKTVADKCKETLNIKNKQSVWISDTVMVKKVKPTQSFLAQDSRNKKPPDCFVTEKMVSDFFDIYYKKMVPAICAPYTTTTWLSSRENYVCNYFIVKPDKISDASTSFHEGGETEIESNTNGTITGNNIDDTKRVSNVIETATPASLNSLCTAVLKRHITFFDSCAVKNDDHQISFIESELKQNQSPSTLFRLCLNVIISGVNYYSHKNISSNPNNFREEKMDDNLEQIKMLPNDEETSKPLEVQSGIGFTDVQETDALIDDKSHFLKDTDIANTNALLDVDIKKGFPEDETESLPDVDPKKLYPDSDVEESYILSDDKQMILSSLKSFCFKKIKELFFKSFNRPESSLGNDDNLSENSFALSETGSYDLSISNYKIDDMIAELDSVVRNNVKSLFSLCVEKIQKKQKDHIKNIMDLQENALLRIESPVDDITGNTTFTEISPNSIKSLKCLSFITVKNIMYDKFDYCDDVCQNKDGTNTKLQKNKTVYNAKRLADICFEIISAYIADYSEDVNLYEKTDAGMTINCVNTVSEEAFHNMEEENMEDDDGEDFYDEDNYEGEFHNVEDQDEENNWETQVQLQEFKPCLETHKQSGESQITEDQTLANENRDPFEEEPVVPHIKLEPLDEPTEAAIETTFVKTEPLHHDEMTIIPESIMTKQECTEEANDGSERLTLQRQNSSSFDVDTFEDFVRQNKMMHPLDEPNDETFTQSGSRVRRQHEPDYMNEYDPSLNLLVPQTFEPLSVVNAKGVLMESSSDDESSNQKTNAKKKIDKKGRGRPKKNDNKQQSKDAGTSKQNQDNAYLKQSKEPPTAKGKVPAPPSVNEVAILTRRMREKIRQEEKKVESSDSEGENVPITRKKDKDRKENEKSKSLKSKEKQDKPIEDEIQCSNVDSTEQIEQNDDNDKNFTGFSTVDQNEITSYQKYVKFVYDKILPKHTESSNQDASPNKQKIEILPLCNSKETEENERTNSPLINYDEPTEMLECEPTMPIFDDNFEDINKRKRSKPKSKIVKNKEAVKAQENVIETEGNMDKVKYTEHNGWQCYPIEPNETKLYQNTAIILEKLPESFVQTYFEYQEITYNQDEDKEVNRLINLNTLKRSSVKEVHKLKEKTRITKDGPSGKTADTSRAATPTSEGCAELTASEDEGANVDDEEAPPVPFRNTNENCLAKNSLMDDSDSDETKVKEEPQDGTQSVEPNPQSKKKSKGKAAKESQPPLKSEHPESLMLTADKMMNKELNLLHAPVVLNNDVTDKIEKGPSPKNKSRRSLRGHSSRDHMKNDEDSSSEEEKQWVSTKEKLLKRMGKKEDTTIADDAKRTKLVTEFIERRGGKPESRKIGRGRGRKRSARKMLEREKQMRVLSHELFGTPVDPALMGTRHAQFSQSYFKGRRNIRKVIDKKSLARSTVIANMEEFERKCRLNQRQAQLRELLGCEDGVNVLVINDEVCLEYGFEEMCPLVSVHPFFTKVMKAHQYEGVKFMWDACFESLEKVESGHLGGGCILAHCMGLGKTLQVLALLHTVLTHPRVGMQRVLVCCPLSTVLNWVDEIHKWIGPVTDQIKVFELSKLKKTYERAYQLEDWYSGGGIFIIGYELFRSLTTLDSEFDDIRPTIVNKIRTALLDPGPDIIVCDEGHLLKNDCSVLAVAMSRVATKRRIVLTGTPMQNNLREYYCMVNFVKPNLLGTYSEYSNRFENPIMNGQHRDSQEEDIKLMKQRTHILHKVLEGCLQRQEASVLYPYLPKKHEYTVFISLTKVQWDLYKHYINNYSTNNTKQSVLKDFHILQKIWSHPQVLHNFQTKRRDEAEARIKAEKLEDDLAHEDLTSEVLKSEDVKPSDVWWLQYLDGGSMLDSLECSNKFVVIFKILDECIALGDKVLIFSTSLFTMDALEYFLKNINKWSLGQDYYRLDGSVPAEVRQKWCREFNAEHNIKTKLFLISTRAGSLGLNMVAANRVIILDTSWNPAHDIQSIFRVYRFGQKKDCYIYRLVALGTMEQKIYERSVTKQAIACRVVDEQQIDRHYNLAELTELYKYDEMGLSVSGGVAVGVTDVALLRVARHPALHAVHEHDSLLRGSSEQQLPEHERAAAWMQFQQEHANKQMQNQLVSSFSLHLPLPNAQQTYQQLINDNGLRMPEVKPEHNLLVPYQPQPPPPDQKKTKKGKKKFVVDVPLQEEPRQDPDNEAIQDEMANKIMNILLRHNFQNRHEPRAIAELVSTVRKIVTHGYVPKGSFDNDVAMQIANVLLMKQPKATATVTQPESSEPQPLPKKRGRPKKGAEEPLKITPQPESLPSTSQTDYKVYTPGRRRAAINAENSLKEVVVEQGEEEGDGDRRDEDWQNDDSGTEEIVPEAKPQKKTKTAPVTVKTENETTSQPTEDSILLSDDDEPGYLAPPKQAKKQTKKPQKTEPQEEVIPLHPSLLNNKNFVKIVAHTYLEGNPMLDEDAATLAAQYSTLKAKKEIEATGKPIVSGPIYDIAIKVLGIDILKKLHKANPNIKVGESKAPEPPPVEVKSEPVADTRKPGHNSEPVAESRKPGSKSEPVAETRKPGPRLKARGLSELTGNNSPAPASATPTASTVVPVGLINRSGDITPNVAPVTPAEQLMPLAPPHREESILPDDDDVIISDQPAHTLPKNIFKKNAKPLVLNSVLASTKAYNTPATNSSAQPKIPKLVISAGKLLPAKGFATTLPPKIVPTPAATIPPPAPQPTTSHDTICLDSDEETITSEPAPKPKKRVAVKSTAKPHRPAPAPVPASAPVPVRITAANPQLNAVLNNHQQQHITNAQLTAMLNQQQAPFTTNVNETFGNQSMYSQQQYTPLQVPQPQVSGGTIMLGPGQPTSVRSFAGGNYVVVPASNLTRLPPGVTPAAHNQSLLRPAIPQTSSYQNVMTQPVTSVMQTPLLQNVKLQPMRAPQYHNTSAPAPQYNNTSAPAPQYHNISVPAPQYHNISVPAPQYHNISAPAPQYHNISAPAPQYHNMAAPAPSPAAPESILPTTNPPMPMQTPNKTVCKPGDILRITKTGQIEVLNRGDDDVSIVVDADNTAPSQPTQTQAEAPEPRRTRARSSVASQPAPSPTPPKTPQAPKTAQPPSASQPQRATQPTKPPEKTDKVSERSRKVSVSSSSSSESSRPSTPEDPLSILKDVVHIKAPEEDSPRVSKPTMVGNTSITSSKSTEPVILNKAYGKEPARPASKPSTPAKKVTQNEILKHISRTDTILKKLDKSLTPGKNPATTQRSSTAVNKSKPAGPPQTVDTIDLDSYEAPVKTTNTKQTPGSSRQSSSAGAKNTAMKSASQSKPGPPAKPATQTKSAPPAKPVPKKIVGTSKDIIISVTGKSSILTTANSANKTGRVATVEKLAPAPSTSKKRPAPTDSGQQKKRAAPMTLKDFNIDDIDDIIELE